MEELDYGEGRNYNLPSRLKDLITQRFLHLKNNFYNYSLIDVCKHIDSDGIPWIRVWFDHYEIFYRITEKNEFLTAREKFFYALPFIADEDENPIGDGGDIIQYYDIEFLDEVRKKIGEVLTIYNTYRENKDIKVEDE